MIAAACGQLVPQIAEILLPTTVAMAFVPSSNLSEGGRPALPQRAFPAQVGAMRSRGRHGYSAHFTMPSAANRAICSSL